MANVEYRIPLTKSIYVNSDTPYTVIPTVDGEVYEIRYTYMPSGLGTGSALLFGYETDLSSLAIRHRPLVNVQIVVHTKSNLASTSYDSHIRCRGTTEKVKEEQSILPETFTWNSYRLLDQIDRQTVRETYFKSIAIGGLPGTGNRWADTTSRFRDPSSTESLYNDFPFHGGWLALDGYLNSDQASAYAKTVLADGSRPYIKVVYDDSDYVRCIPTISTYFSNNTDPTQDITVEFSLAKDTTTGNCLHEEWDFNSATLYWRTTEEVDWHSITVSESVDSKQIIVPANTFPPGKTIKLYMTAVDDEGITTSPSVEKVFTTQTSTISGVNSPTSGYSNPRVQTNFYASFLSSSGRAAKAGTAVLHWRVQGDSEWNDVNSTASTEYVIGFAVPANTFPIQSVIEWYLTGTDISGYASTSQTYSFSTTAASVSTTALTPKNTIETLDEPITLTWSYASDDSMPTSRILVSWKYQGEADTQLRTLLDTTQYITEYIVPANTLPAGEIEWLVIPYNIDGVLGTYTSSSFISYGAPVAPVVYADDVPYTTVSWQSTNQDAYEVTIDDTVYGPYFGNEKEFAVPDRLSDGSHVVKVRTMGNYALWSKYGSTTISVANTPGEDISLSVSGRLNANLLWECEDQDHDFYIFRDGELIGHTDKYSFVDNFASGAHVYTVVNRLSNGNYTESPEVEFDVSILNTVISSAESGVSVEIKHALKSNDNLSFNDKHVITVSQLSGNTYPSVFRSMFRENTLNLSAVFLYNEQEDEHAFRQLLGVPVIIKSRHSETFVGIIDSWSRTYVRDYYVSYSFSVRRIEWDDYIDDTE